MPVYTVANRAQTAPWNLVNGPPAAPAPPRLVVAQIPNMASVAMGQQLNVALGPNCTGLFTHHLTDCSAFTVLYRPGGAGPWTQAAMIHMAGGPDPNAVNWPTLLNGMGPGGTFYGILANSRATVLSPGFVQAVLNNTPIPAGNVWVYNGEHPAISYAVDWNGFTGEL